MKRASSSNCSIFCNYFFDARSESSSLFTSAVRGGEGTPPTNLPTTFFFELKRNTDHFLRSEHERNPFCCQFEHENVQYHLNAFLVSENVSRVEFHTPAIPFHSQNCKRCTVAKRGQQDRSHTSGCFKGYGARLGSHNHIILQKKVKNIHFLWKSGRRITLYKITNWISAQLTKEAKQKALPICWAPE